jgi:pyruvate,orthophosphate dikinase
MGWADEVRKLGVRAPTPTRPRTRAAAREFGAEGIGLCRTEHMFFEPTTHPRVREMILADDEEGRARRSPSCCRCSAATSRLFEAMAGCR